MSKYSEELLEWAMETLLDQNLRRYGVVSPDSVLIEVVWVNFGDPAECCDAQLYDEEGSCDEEGEIAIRITGEEPLHHFILRNEGNASRYRPVAWVLPAREPAFEQIAQMVNKANGVEPPAFWDEK
jgi:hypothetical protein